MIRDSNIFASIHSRDCVSIHSGLQITVKDIECTDFIGIMLFGRLFTLQDAERMEKVSKRVAELETVSNNIKLLAEMLQHYSASTASEGERDLMKVNK